MAIYNLPPFGSRADFPSATDGGRWTRAAGTLAELAQSLRVGKDDDEKAGTADIKSVPDPWAQIRMFADAVAGDHPLHDVSVAQWRGLLALLALEVGHEGIYALNCTSVPLRGAPTASEPRGPDSRSLFERILTRLPPMDRLPQSAVAGDGRGPATAEWNEPVILNLRLVEGLDANQRRRYGKDIPVGVMNPACLVAPGRRTASRHIPEIKWMASGLSDPTALEGADALPLGHYVILREWLAKLYDELSVISGGTRSRLLDALRTQVDDFHRICAGITAGCPIVASGSGDRHGNLPPLYAALRRRMTLKPSENPSGVSECIVALRDDLKNLAPFKGIVLLDPEIARVRKKYPKDVLVWGNTTLAEVEPDSPAMLKLADAVAAEGYFLAQPKDLFTHRLAQLSHRAIIDGHANGLGGQLLPVSPLALMLLEPAALANAIRTRDQGGDRVVVEMTLTLAGPQPANHTVARGYAERPRGDEGILDPDVDWTFGEAAVWPNFRSDAWRWYFLRMTYPTSGETIRARFGMSGRGMATFLSSQPEGQWQSILKDWCDESRCRAERLPPLSGRVTPQEPPQWLERLRSFDDSEVVEEYQSSPFGFEAVFFSRMPEDAREASPVGCAVLRMSDGPRGAGSAGVVAVDFGTTNTVACFDKQTPIIFKDRILHPIRSHDSIRMKRGQQLIRWPFVEFLPPSDRSTPTPTVGLDRNADKLSVLTGPDGHSDPRLLFGNVIYFQPEEGAAADVAANDVDRFKGVLNRTRFNLKWGEEADVRVAAFRYLRQFIMMTAAEALLTGLNLEKLTWKFSRPDAMERDQQSKLRQELKTALGEITPGGIPPKLYSESIAAAKYILNGGEGGDRVRGKVNIVVDIGGGSTDVAIWEKDELAWTGSYRLAGGQFFTEHLINNPNFFRIFGLPTWADIIAPSDDRAVRIEPGRRPSVGELLFSGPRLGEALNSHWNINSETPEAKALTRTAFTFLGGLAWYLGLVTKGLIATGKVDAESLDGAAFALCGRGSGLFARLHGGGRPSEESAVSRLLTMFARAAGAETPRRPSLFVSPTPKIEVAGGMVSDGPVVDLDEKTEGEVFEKYFEPAGLNIPSSRGHALGAQDDISALPPGGRSDYPALEELEAFLEALANFGGFRIDLRKGDNDGTWSRVRNEVFTMVELHRGAGLREPPFITALRAIISDMARSEVERGNHLTVQEASRTGRH